MVCRERYEGVMTDTQRQAQVGSTDDAMRMLRDVDPERFAAVQGFGPTAWLAELVRTRREQLGVTQRQLAEAIGSTQAAVSRLESGETDPSFSRACIALAALGQQLVPAPRGEDLMVLSRAQLNDIVAETLQHVVADIKQVAVSEALVQIASTGLAPMSELPDAMVGAPVRK